MRQYNASYRSLVAALGLGLAISVGAEASVVSGSAQGYGVSSELSAFGGNLGISVPPTPNGASVSSAPPASASDSVLGLEVSDSHSTGLPPTNYALGLSTGLLSAEAASDVDGGTGARHSEASALVNDLGFGVGTLNLLNVLTATVVDLSAATLSSNASVSGEAGSFVASGSASLENAYLSVAGLSLLGLGVNDTTGALVANPSPNLIILDALGITVTLNRQIVDCLFASCSISVDALVVEFTDFVFGGSLLNGDLVIGHSQASLNASPVPLPAAAWLFGSGLMVMLTGNRLVKRPGRACRD